MNNDKEFRHHIAKVYLEGFKKENTPLYYYESGGKIKGISLKSKILGDIEFYSNNTEVYLNKFESSFSYYRDCLETEINSKIKTNISEFSKIVSVFFLRTLYQKNYWENQSQLIIQNKTPLKVPISTLGPIKQIQFEEYIKEARKNNSNYLYISPPEEPDENWIDLVKNTFEAEIKKDNNPLISFINEAISKNNFEIIHNKNNYITTENPVILLDKSNKPIKFILTEKIENILFVLNSKIAIHIYKEKEESLIEYLSCIKYLLEKKYIKYIFSGEEDELKNFLKRIEE